MTVSRRTATHAFTLLELLVVIAVSAMLIAIVVPVLGRARGTARSAACQSNLHQAFTAWLMALNIHDFQISYTETITSDAHPNADEYLLEVLPDIADPNIHVQYSDPNGDYSTRGYGDPNNISRRLVCPEAERMYSPTLYPRRVLGYAINTLWQNTQPANFRDNPGRYNDRRQWSDIRSPSTYPWYVDAAFVEATPYYMAMWHVPNLSVGLPGWGVGFHHAGRTSANVAFADGSVRSVTESQVIRDASDVNDLGWFENR